MPEIPFTVYDELPDGLLERDATRLHEILPGPSLIHVPGQRGRALFVSVLLHGNEITGWEAVRRLLQQYADRRLPRSLSLFIGNVAAAAEGRRRLPDQQDYNRIWRGEADTPEHRLARRVLAELDKRELFAAVYACVNRPAVQPHGGLLHQARFGAVPGHGLALPVHGPLPRSPAHIPGRGSLSHRGHGEDPAAPAFRFR